MYSSRRKPTPGNLLIGMLVTGFMALTGMVIFFASIIPGFFNARRLVSDGKPLTAQITGMHSSKSRHYADYSFEVSGKA